jgi:secondary thiamine-phosphate synthase enzyme
MHGAYGCVINTRLGHPAAVNASTGGIAQLGERRVRIAKARGSNPLTSTIEIRVQTPRREALVDMTAQIEAALAESAPDLTGLLNIFVPHTTAGVTINEGADPAVAEDIIEGLARLIPRDAGYRHSEGNSDAHLKTSLVGNHVVIPVDKGRLTLGTWQSIYLAEFDGPRTRRVSIVPGQAR